MKSKIIYSIITLFTALVAGEMFNIDHYLPMYLSIIIYVLVLGTAFLYYEAKTENEEVNKEHTKIKTTTIIFYIMLSNAVFYSIIKMGQNNSKLFMQYDFQKFLSIEMVTYYITTIVFISRIARLVGNIIFGKIYLKIKDKMSIVFTEVRIEDRDGVELSFMEGGCLDELDIRELLKHDQPFRDMWDAVGSDARIAVQQYRFRGGKQGEELGDENHFALMRAYDRALSDEDGSTFVERDDVDWLDDFELTKDDLADGK